MDRCQECFYPCDKCEWWNRDYSGDETIPNPMTEDAETQVLLERRGDLLAALRDDHEMTAELALEIINELAEIGCKIAADAYDPLRDYADALREAAFGCAL